MVECVRDQLTGFGIALLSGWRCAKQFTWKWQCVIRFHVPLIRTLPTLQVTYSAAVVADGKGPILSINAKLVYDFGEAIRTLNLITSCMVLLQCARRLTSKATWYEGCDCHEHLLTDPSIPAAKRRGTYQRLAKDCVNKRAAAAQDGLRGRR